MNRDELRAAQEPLKARYRAAAGGDGTTLARLAAPTERCCVVGQSLQQPPTVEVRRRAPLDR